MASKDKVKLQGRILVLSDPKLKKLYEEAMDYETKVQEMMFYRYVAYNSLDVDDEDVQNFVNAVEESISLKNNTQFINSLYAKLMKADPIKNTNDDRSFVSRYGFTMRIHATNIRLSAEIFDNVLRNVENKEGGPYIKWSVKELKEKLCDKFLQMMYSNVNVEQKLAQNKNKKFANANEYKHQIAKYIRAIKPRTKYMRRLIKAGYIYEQTPSNFKPERLLEANPFKRTYPNAISKEKYFQAETNRFENSAIFRKASTKGPKNCIGIMSPIQCLLEHINTYIGIDGVQKIFIVKAKTGSGKSTQIPTSIMTSGYNLTLDGKPHKIVCTQPRILTARDMVYTTSRQLGVPPGTFIGYHAGGEKMETKGVTELWYMTEGTVLQKLMMDKDKFFKRYKYIILDEIHENTTEMAIILDIMRNKIAEPDNDNVVIVTSATMDEEYLARYFGVWEEDTPINEQPHIFLSEGQSKKRIDYWPQETPKNMAECLVKGCAQILAINQKEAPGEHILFFLPTVPHISAVENMLERACRELKIHIKPFAIIKYHSNITEEEEDKRDKPLNQLVSPTGEIPIRKVFLSTDRAETGVTFKGLVHLIDSGLRKSVVYNPLTGSTSEVITEVSKNSSNQRAGRVGRDSDGKFYPLYTKENYQKMNNESQPQIYLSSFARNLLSILCKKPVGESFLCTIPEELLIDAYRTLYNLGAIDEKGEPLKQGVLIDEIAALGVENARMLLEGCVKGCSYNVAMILACIDANIIPSSSDIFRGYAYKSDHIHMMLLLEEYKNQVSKEDRQRWCKNNGVGEKDIENANKRLLEYLVALKNKRLPISVITDGNYKPVIECLAVGMRKAVLCEETKMHYIVECSMHEPLYCRPRSSFLYFYLRKHEVLGDKIAKNYAAAIGKAVYRKTIVPYGRTKKDISLTEEKLHEYEQEYNNRMRDDEEYSISKDTYYLGAMPKTIIFSGLITTVNKYTGTTMAYIRHITALS